jgi:thiol-disulfide isomerase/thioredoxin
LISGPTATPRAAGASPGPTAGARATPSAGAAGSPAAAPSVNLKCRTGAKSVGSGFAARGTRFIDFSATTVDCKALTLSSTINGHPALVNFFASWCAPCKGEARDIADLYRLHHDSHFQVVAVDTQYESGDPTPFYRDYGYTFPGVWDDGEKISSAYFANHTLPVLVWVKCDGTIYDLHIGEMTRADMNADYEGIKC